MGDADDVQMLPTCSQSSVCPFRYNHVDSDWQQRTCSAFRLKYIGPNGITPGGPEVCMTKPLSERLIYGDGNGLFRSLSFIITGDEKQHMQAHEIHRKFSSQFFCVDYTGVEEYIYSSRMEHGTQMLRCILYPIC